MSTTKPALKSISRGHIINIDQLQGDKYSHLIASSSSNIGKKLFMITIIEKDASVTIGFEVHTHTSEKYPKLGKVTNSLSEAIEYYNSI